MTTAFPTALDAFTNPTPTDDVSVVSHADQHANANDAIEALQAKVGIDNSADPTSLDARVNSLERSAPKAVTLTIPNGRGVFEATQDFVDATVLETDKIMFFLAATTSADENEPETLSIESISGQAGTGVVTAKLAFRERTSGPIKLNYMVI
jgi:hypothetical protein